MKDSGDVRTVEIKLDRARMHALDLRDSVAAYVATRPLQAEWIGRSDGGMELVVTSIQAPPVDLALVLGDAVHNARCALDYLVWQLVLLNASEPTSKNQFPICNNSGDFGNERGVRLRGVSQEHADLIEELHPWKEGNPELWLLHRVDIDDKHRLVSPVVAGSTGSQLLFPPGSPFEGVNAMGLLLISADPTIDIQVGTVIGTKPAGDESNDPPPWLVDDISLVFSSGSDAMGTEITQFVLDTINLVDSIVAQFRPAFA